MRLIEWIGALFAAPGFVLTLLGALALVSWWFS